MPEYINAIISHALPSASEVIPLTGYYFLVRLLAPAPRECPTRAGKGVESDQGYVMLARSGGQGGGRPLAGRGASPPRLFLSGVAWGALNSPGRESLSLDYGWNGC